MSIWTTSTDYLLGLFNCERKSARYGYSNPAIYYGINRISGNVGSLNCDLFRSDGRTTEKLSMAPSSYLLNKNPSSIYRPIVFKQTIVWHAIWDGNGRAYIHRDGRHSELLILNPDSTTTGMVDGEKYHATYINPQGNQPDSRVKLFEEMMANPNYTVVIPDSECFHIVGIGDGINGFPLWKVARVAIEAMVGADCQANEQINKGFVGKVMLEVPETSGLLRTQEQANEFLEDYIKKHGSDGAGQQVGMLRGGITAKTLSVQSNNDAQFLETRKYLREDAALLLGLEHIPGSDTNTSYNSLEQAQLSYLLNCLEPWLTKFEQEADKKLLSQTQFESGNYYHKFNTAAMLRTDLSTTAETFSKLIAARVINPNEARAKMDMNPYPGGDEFENPAISPGTPGTTDEPEEPTEPNEQAQAAVNMQINKLLNQEQLKVNKKLKRGDTMQEIERWYDAFETTLGNAIENLGGDRLEAQKHCITSLQKIAANPDKDFSTGMAGQVLTRKILTHV